MGKIKVLDSLVADMIAAGVLENLLKTRYNATVDVITNVGAVIGSHSGPGTLALFFVGNVR